MSLKKKKILITYGPTNVALDPIRVISNRSTGELGKMITQALIRKKAKVTVLEGAVRQPLKLPKRSIQKFFYYSEFAQLINKTLKLKQFDIIIHAAAVSDFQPERIHKSKISSSRKELTLKLVPTKKLINNFKRHAPKSFLVGFKLKVSTKKQDLLKAAYNLQEETGCDLIVSNYSDKGNYRALLVDKTHKLLAIADSKLECSRKLINILEHQL